MPRYQKRPRYRKAHFVQLGSLAAQQSVAYGVPLKDLLRDLIVIFRHDNPRFNEKKFLAYCVEQHLIASGKKPKVEPILPVKKP